MRGYSSESEDALRSKKVPREASSETEGERRTRWSASAEPVNVVGGMMNAFGAQMNVVTERMNL